MVDGSGHPAGAERTAAVWAVVGVLALLAGCGGGGGGDSGAGGGSPPATAPIDPPAPPPTSSLGRVAWAQSEVRVERDVFDTTQILATAALTVESPTARYWFSYTYNRDLAEVTYSPRPTDGGLDFQFRFWPFPVRPVGSYPDTLSVRLCLDEACTKPVPGSPFTIPVRLAVGYFAQAEAGLTPLALGTTRVLAHDVVDAAYSAALDAVVTVSALPSPMLRVHELRSGATREVALLTPPTSMSLGPDGLLAAVGHDAAVSIVNLPATGSPTVRRVTVPTQVRTVALSSSRVLAIGGTAFSSGRAYWVDTATDAVVELPMAMVYGAGDTQAHPAGDRVYTASTGLSPDDVYRIDLLGDPTALMAVDSRYHGDYSFCGRFALSPDGARLYSGCGTVLSLSATAADDMVYAGTMPMSPRDPNTFETYRARALSVAPDNRSLSLFEEAWHPCSTSATNTNGCHTRLARHDTQSLARTSLRGLPVHLRGSDRLRQWGRELMHRSDGSLLLITEVRTRDEATPTWLLHHVTP